VAIVSIGQISINPKIKYSILKFYCAIANDVRGADSSDTLLTASRDLLARRARRLPL